MAPIEYFFAIIGGVIAIVSLIRGYAKELGNTLVFLVAIFIFSMADRYIDQILDVARETVSSIPAPETLAFRQLLCISYIAVFTAIVFASYAGRTFDYGGRQAPPPQGTLLNFGIGILNAYLVAGTYWYFLHRFDYPFTQISTPLTSTAEGLVRLLPLQLFENPIYWMLPVALLILLKVRG